MEPGDKKAPLVSDRELLIAVFSLLGALAERLTGDIPLVCVRETTGETTHIYPATPRVNWFRTQGPTFDGHGSPAEQLQCPLHARRPCTELEPCRVHQSKASPRD